MPYQNRVTPFGQLIAVPERGAWMGNRGLIHDERKQIVRLYKEKRWIICQLEYKGIRREIMAPGRYTELFFLDEATALSAGHRPCSYCSHARFREFQEKWAVQQIDNRASPEWTSGRLPTAGVIDQALHTERIDAWGRKILYPEQIDGLPDGCFIQLDEEGPAYLVLGTRLLEWTSGGYTRPVARPAGRQVQVLTPRSTVRVIQAGYRPQIAVPGT